VKKASSDALFALVLCVIVPCLLVASCNLRAGDVVLIPSGFRGWVVIRYEVAGKPYLGHAGTKTLVRVPSTGLVETASDRANGYGSDEYTFVNDSGGRAEIPNEQVKGCSAQDICIQRFEYFSAPAKVTVFFVGAAIELAKYPRPNIQ
jgi:hypothetical protein